MIDLLPPRALHITDQIYDDLIRAVGAEPSLNAMRAAAQRISSYGYGL